MEAPWPASDFISAEYLSDLEIAAEKILGLVVTPTTFDEAIKPASEPLSNRSRDRSSSQIATPASDNSLSDDMSTPVILLMRWTSWRPQQRSRP